MAAKINTNQVNRIFSLRNITPQRVALLGVYLSLMVTFKYLFGFIPGIELVTFMFVIVGIFFPLVDGLLLVVSFNFIMIALYGWNTWQLPYWIIWPFDIVTSKLMVKFTKNKYILGTWAFLCGLFVAFWYFVSDLILYGESFALLNIISALPINLIEGAFTMFVFLIAAPAIGHVIKTSASHIWPGLVVANLGPKGHKNHRIYMGLTLGICLLLAIAIILIFIFNYHFLDIKNSLMDHGPATKLN